ncbi:polyprenyl synthetase family protein [bacterium]|nr:polyprenyl synthetase family protein [bacterium]
MKLSEFSKVAIPKIETEMKAILHTAKQKGNDSLYQMLAYHLGWSGENISSHTQGKRIRPLLLLLTTGAAGGNWEEAIAGAATVELIHNFSLIHDDIEDNSEERRGRKTLWVIHSLPLALNAGDALFSLAFMGLSRLATFHNAETALQAFTKSAETCLTLTKGQHLDISFETSRTVTIDQYLEMIAGKTAALLSLSAELGAVLAHTNPENQENYRAAGENLGLAFQVIDDILGIWGNPEKTGKSAASDLLSRKKSLPILYGLGQKGQFSEMWEAPITPANVSRLAEQLKSEGAYDYAKEKAQLYTQSAVTAIQNANPSGIYAEAFTELTNMLIQRDF